MGVQGLWDLVAPAGRRIKISTLEGKILAIDVSIWLLRILHGHVSVGKNEFSNVHLVGVLKRIIKLMFYGIKPVFVFDGKFPDLKKETVHQRQMMRENRKRDLKKIAEKYLAKVLEQRIKETIRGGQLQKKGSRNSDNFVVAETVDEAEEEEEEEEEEHYFYDNEESKQAHKQKKKVAKKEKEKDENEDSEKEIDAMLYDYEFDIILEENKDLLIESGINMEEFYKQDLSKQYNTIKKFRNNMRERKMKKYLAIDNLDEFSKIHIKDYVKNCKRKNQAEKNKIQAQAQKMSDEQGNILGNVRYSDLAKNSYMMNLFMDPRKNVVQKTLISNRNKGFIYMERKDKKNENHMLKLGNKKQTKFERLRKLAAKMKEIGQNAEVGYSYFSFEEILADNPLDAFKFQIQKGDIIPQKDSLNHSELETVSQAKLEKKLNVDVDEIFGFDDWEDVEEDDSSKLSDKKELIQLTKNKKKDKKDERRIKSPIVKIQTKTESNDEDLMDLFEYKIEEDENDFTKQASDDEKKQNKSQKNSVAKEEVGRNGIQRIARELEEREKQLQQIQTKEEGDKMEDETPEYKRMKLKKKDFDFDDLVPENIESKYYQMSDEHENSKTMKKVVKKTKNKINEVTVGNSAKDAKQLLFERIEARALSKATSLESNKDKFGSVDKEPSSFSFLNESSHRYKLETPSHDDSFSISTKDTETKSKLTGSQMFAERESIITKTVNKWLGLHDNKDSVATAKSKKQQSKILIEDHQETEKKKNFQQNQTKEIFMKDVEKNEDKSSLLGSPIRIFEKGHIEDLYDPSSRKDLFWNELKKSETDSNQKSEKEKIFKEKKTENIQIEEEEVIIEIQYTKEERKEPNKKIEKNDPELKSIIELSQEDNQNSTELPVASQDNWEDLDEDALLAKMKELEEDDVTDKWALMEQFQKFQNLSELEGGSIQDKLREIKEMLIMFGIPWVDSPAEAEAQCSFLEMNGLVDGVITDDSDVFLFGARHVYRNMFDKGDFAHAYPMRSVEQELGLDRTKLILLALFLGSDYTLGIKGVGIVNAMEIVEAFETLDSLERFKAWAEMPDVFMEDPTTHYKNISPKEVQYKLKHRNYKKHWELPKNFPDERVFQAYEKPFVDESLEKFEWGIPNVEALEDVCKTRFKWDEERIINTLEPLKKAMKEKKAQKRITDFFREEKFAQINSKRLNQTIKSMNDKENSNNEAAELTEDIERKIQKQNANRLKRAPTQEQNNELQEFAFQKKKTKKTIAL